MAKLNPLKLKIFSRVLPDDLESQVNDWISITEFELVDIHYYVKDKIYCFILYREAIQHEQYEVADGIRKQILKLLNNPTK